MARLLQLLFVVPAFHGHGAGQDLDPCTLLTPAEIAPLMRDSVTAGVRSGRTCRWKPATGPGSVTIQITPTGGPAVYQRELKLLGADQTLTDLGDEAFVTGTIVGIRLADRIYLGRCRSQHSEVDAAARRGGGAGAEGRGPALPVGVGAAALRAAGSGNTLSRLRFRAVLPRARCSHHPGFP